MSTESVAGDVRTAVVAWGGVSGRAFRDAAPNRATFPYVTFFEMPSTPRLSGDGRVVAWARQVQVSLWQTLKTENRTLVADLTHALDGINVGIEEYGCHVVESQRLPDPAGEVVQDALTILVTHNGAKA